MGYKKEQLREKRCPVCGKIFFPSPEHVYKDKRTWNRLVCSWSCVLASERLKEAAKKQKKKEVSPNER